VPGELDDVDLPGRGDDAGRAGAADVGEEGAEEGAVGGGGAALESEALFEDAAAQVEGLARREGPERVGLLRALRVRQLVSTRRRHGACNFFQGFAVRPRTCVSKSFQMLCTSASVSCHICVGIRTI
jgi:hypothetical protein